MVSFVRKGLLALSVTIAASAILAVASAYAATGGGCNLSPDGYVQVCISENAQYWIVPDAYVSPYTTNCQIWVDEYIDGSWSGDSGPFYFDGGGHFYGPLVQATPGHKYEAFVSSLICNEISTAAWSPSLYT